MVGLDPKSTFPNPEAADVVAGVAELPRFPKLSPKEGVLVYESKTHIKKISVYSILLTINKLNNKNYCNFFSFNMSNLPMDTFY